MNARVAKVAVISLAIGVAGCGGDGSFGVDDELGGGPVETETSAQGLTINRRLHTFRTKGKLTLKVWQCTSVEAVAHPTVPCSIDSDFVLVGGSGFATTASPGAFLTASFPSSDTTWTAASKDHGVSHPHTLNTFVHGLKVEGMTRAQLAQNVIVNLRTSALESHPKLTALPVPADKFMLTTGARLNYGSGPGNLLTGVWTTGVRGKDHFFASPATVDMWDLWINKILPAGTLTWAQKNGTGANVDTGLGSANVRLSTTLELNSFLEVGAFGFAVFFNPGRMLVGYGYTPGRAVSLGYEAWTKDHLEAARGQALVAMTMLCLSKPGSTACQ